MTSPFEAMPPKEVAEVVVVAAVRGEVKPSPPRKVRNRLKRTLPNEVTGLFPQLPVGGRLQMFQDFWTCHTSDIWAQDIVSRGYSLEFLHPYPPLEQGIVIPTIVRADREVYVLEEIQDLLKKGSIERVDPDSPGFYSVFFLVEKKDGGYRPILNLKPLNQFMKQTKFKMETPITITFFASPDFI